MAHTLASIAPHVNSVALPRLSSAATNLSDESVHKPKGTARVWFEAHKGQRVDTLQVQPHSVWAPTNRMISTITPSRVTFLSGGYVDNVNSTEDPTDSSRDFKGLKVLHADDTTLLVGYEFGGPCVALYTIAL